MWTCGDDGLLVRWRRSAAEVRGPGTAGWYALEPGTGVRDRAGPQCDVPGGFHAGRECPQGKEDWLRAAMVRGDEEARRVSARGSREAWPAHPGPPRSAMRTCRVSRKRRPWYRAMGAGRGFLLLLFPGSPCAGHGAAQVQEPSSPGQPHAGPSHDCLDTPAGAPPCRRLGRPSRQAAVSTRGWKAAWRQSRVLLP
jgi:hypothetical protein